MRRGGGGFVRAGGDIQNNLTQIRNRLHKMMFTYPNTIKNPVTSTFSLAKLSPNRSYLLWWYAALVKGTELGQPPVRRRYSCRRLLCRCTARRALPAIPTVLLRSFLMPLSVSLLPCRSWRDAVARFSPHPRRSSTLQTEHNCLAALTFWHLLLPPRPCSNVFSWCRHP